MPPVHTRAPAAPTRRIALVALALASGNHALSGCRYGYEELALAGGAAAASPTESTGGTEVGGGAPNQGGEVPVSGGANDGGGGSASDAGSGSGAASGSGAGTTSEGGGGGSTGGSSVGGSSVGGSSTGGSNAGGSGPTGCRTAQYGGHAYAMCDSGSSYDAARTTCESGGMRLARIDDDAENAWVHATIPAADQASSATEVWRWLGADDLQTLGEWRWADGTLFWTGGSKGMVEPGMYANWTKNQPLNPHCLAMRASDGAWFAMTCSDARPYVCEQY